MVCKHKLTVRGHTRPNVCQCVSDSVGTVDVPGGQGVGGTVEVTEGEAATGDALLVMQCTAKSVFCFIVF